MPVSLPVWTKIGYLQSHFATLKTQTFMSIINHIYATQLTIKITISIHIISIPKLNIYISNTYLSTCINHSSNTNITILH
ncbi:hypothetical protein F383_00625 [Gossypium arboreum]|uniref:Uncharacterized protein n=1 Tax=Gossypium arboreum TaxID=29729 RepID=A0A0B0P8Q4_GOSAR|nr:hypothetical protein F383_00625 [Gossypium arboreum]